MDLSNAIVYDIETFPNCFTLTAEMLHNDVSSTWEISHYRNDRRPLMEWFNYLQSTQTPMIGFYSLHFDYIVCHYLYNNPNASVEQIYAHAMAVINSPDRFGYMIWDRDRFAPQIDLFKVHHFDNRAKTTSLKALEINMRASNVRECRVPFGQPVSEADVRSEVIPYNAWDTTQTKQFAHYSMSALNFRVGLIPRFGLEVLNYNDGKIGAKMLEQRLGDDVCYDRSSGRKRPRQTPRYKIALSEIIFPYIKFTTPEFQRVLDFMRQQVLTPDDLDDPDAPLKTKGVINIVANVGGLEFKFGTGGVHASVSAQKFIASEEWPIVDIDVEGLYPRVAIVNNLAPEHLGAAFTTEYPKIGQERKLHAKGTYENASLKLANNVPWGQSNNKYSIFFDPKYAMTIPINGQLMICMLVEWLLTVPTIQLIQANTDGITYRIHHSMVERAREIETQWEAYTCLVLERARYSGMWIRDVNNYIAMTTTGKMKQKGAYEHPDPLDYANSISNMSPPGWHKDWSALVCRKAAIAAMVHGIDPETFIRAHSDPFDFMCRVKVDRASTLYLGGDPIQSTTRYFIALNGAPMQIVRPPAGPEGKYKRKNGVTEAEYYRVMEANGWQWNEAVCTGKANKPDTWGTYSKRINAVEAGWLINECNEARSFSFANVNYAWYVAQAKKLIIG